MRTVWKYELPFEKGTNHVIEVPGSSEFLCVQMQGETPCLWIEVNDRLPKNKHRFVWVGTGTEVPDDSRYRGTVQVRGGAFVFHLYELL